MKFLVLRVRKQNVTNNFLHYKGKNSRERSPKEILTEISKLLKVQFQLESVDKFLVIL